MASKKLVLVKIGGSSITDKTIPYSLKEKNLKRFAKEISSVKNVSLLICHGAGSFAHTSATKYGGKKGYKSKIGIAKVFSDAAKINSIVTDALIEEGVPAVSLRPRGFTIAKAGKLDKLFTDVIIECLRQGLVPVICGDVIFDTKWKTTIYSGEKSLGIIALSLARKGYKISRVIEVGETKGFLDEKGKTVPIINKNNWSEIKENVRKVKGLDVTGGMGHKIEEALSLATKDITTYLIGDKPRSLHSAIIGKPTEGTVVK